MNQSTSSAGCQSIDGPRLSVFDPEASGASDDSTPEKTPAKKRTGKPAADRDLPLWQRKKMGEHSVKKIKGTVHYFRKRTRKR